MIASTRLKTPTYRRQRLLLYFVEAARGSLSKMDLQKLLFLYHQDTDANHYAFVPYRYGSYSFLATEDLDLMVKRGWIQSARKRISPRVSIENEPWARNDLERRTVKRWLHRYPQRGEALVAETYRLFPYYAIHSDIRDRLLSKSELREIETALPELEPRDLPIVFTIGYEGIHFEEYLNKLIRNRVATLCDVRRNPLSRKFGFSGKMLARVLPTLGIGYTHLPDLGIESEQRQELNSMADYECLFTGYRKTLQSRTEGLELLHTIIERSKRVALTCFEAKPQCCHRHCISDHLEKTKGFTIRHL